MNEPSGAALSTRHRLIFEIVREQGIGRHLGMADIFNLAKQRHPGIGFTTVYRALVRLRNLNLISEIALPGADCAYYAPAGEPHAHFRCTVCGSISDVAYAVPEPALDRISAELGVTIVNATVAIAGRCAKCLQLTGD